MRFSVLALLATVSCVYGAASTVAPATYPCVEGLATKEIGEFALFTCGSAAEQCAFPPTSVGCGVTNMRTFDNSPAQFDEGNVAHTYKQMLLSAGVTQMAAAWFDSKKAQSFNAQISLLVEFDPQNRKVVGFDDMYLSEYIINSKWEFKMFDTPVPSPEFFQEHFDLNFDGEEFQIPESEIIPASVKGCCDQARFGDDADPKNAKICGERPACPANGHIFNTDVASGFIFETDQLKADGKSFAKYTLKLDSRARKFGKPTFLPSVQTAHVFIANGDGITPIVPFYRRSGDCDDPADSNLASVPATNRRANWGNPADPNSPEWGGCFGCN